MASEEATREQLVVVLAVDGKEPSMNAFRYYIKYIHRQDNYVILTHAMQLPAMPSRDEWDRTHKEARRASLTVEGQFSEMMDKYKINGTFQAGMEKPGEFIIQTAEQHRAKLIVMGSRQLSAVKRALMGSVSDHVMHNAKCPVLVVRK